MNTGSDLSGVPGLLDKGIKACFCGLLVLAVLLLPLASSADDGKPHVITLRVGHSRVINLPTAVKRASVANNKVADIIMITPRQVYVNPLEVGSTNISFWDKNDKLCGIWELQVSQDLTRLKERLYDVMPTEPIDVRELKGAVVLSGRASSLEAKKQAELLAEQFAPKKVASLIRVSGSQQVILKVRFAEVNRSVTKKWNLNWGAFNPFTGDFFFNMISPLFSFDEVTIGAGKNDNGSKYSTFSSTFTLDNSNMRNFFGFKTGDTKIVGFLDILKENGLAKILAEPSLVAASGEKASFLAGGEYPIPVPQQNGAITIEFKKFGIQLDFQPEILANGRIKLSVKPEVSQLDYTTAILVEGFAVPGLTTRTAKTQIELNSGQSFAIAGLFSDKMSDSVSKLPWLGDVPVLGALFRSSEFQSDKSELVILVTPSIATHNYKAPTHLPGESLKENCDFETFFFGKAVQGLNEEEPSCTHCTSNELEGKYGHQLAY